MPTYVFRCNACHHEFELTTAWSQKSAARCPDCGGTQLHEMMGRYRPLPMAKAESTPCCQEASGFS